MIPAPAQSAMIATPHHLASDIGIEVLRDGGTAVDAAIAANAALTVLLPDQTSIGGDCLFMIWPGDQPSPAAFNGSGRAPATASAATLRQAGRTSMPRRGPLAVTVPGTIDAWFQAHTRYGSLPMHRLLAPASALAREGVPISPRLALAIADSASDIATIPAAARIFLDRGRAPASGFHLANPDLATSLDRIGNEGRDAFYTRHIAEQIVAVAGGEHGWLTMDDLAAHAGTWDEAVGRPYRNATVWEMAPNSQGITALLALEMMNQEPYGDAWDDAAWLHVQIEAKKRAFAMRDQYLGDAAAMTMEMDDILGTGGARWSSFDPDRAIPGQPTLPGDTVYLTAIDGDGLAVSLIQSIYQGFGSGLVAGDTGIVLQNRGSYFSLVDGHPNELAGGKRPLHTLMPGMIDIPGRGRGAFGTQGGDAQAQIHMQLVSHLVDGGASPATAVARPRWLSGDARKDETLAVTVETGMPAGAIAGLRQRGHEVTQAAPRWPHAGYAQIVLRQEDGSLAGAADPRAEGSVAAM